MSDTPRTDNSVLDTDWLGTRVELVNADFARKLERENAALRKDKDRFDWLITKAPFCVLSTLSSDPAAARLKIDREMEFPTV